MGIEGFRKAVLKQMNLSSITDERQVKWSRIVEWMNLHIIADQGNLSFSDWSNVGFPEGRVLIPTNHSSDCAFYYFDFNCLFYFARSNGLDALLESLLERISDPTVEQYYLLTSRITLLFFVLLLHELDILDHGKGVYVAIDGVPPMAKHLGKKKKWLRKAVIDSFKSHIIPKKGFLTDARIFTFGTGFMEFFQSEMDLLTRSLIQRYGLEVGLSDSNHRGEGEIKIIRHLSNHPPKGGESIFIWSPDSDIILHCLLTYLKFDQKESNDIVLYQFEPTKSGLYTISVRQLYKTLVGNFKYCSSLSDRSVIQDVCLLFSMVGNDFVPPFKFLLKNQWYELLKLTYHRYQDCHPGRHFIGSKHGKCRLNLENLLNYFKVVEQYEPILLKEHYLYHRLENYREFWFYWQKLIKSSKNDQDKISHLKRELVLSYGSEGEHDLFLVALLILKKTVYNEIGDLVSTDDKLDYVNLCEKKKQFNYLLTYFHGKSSYQLNLDRLSNLLKENPDQSLEDVLINNTYLEYHDLLNSEAGEVTLDFLQESSLVLNRLTDQDDLSDATPRCQAYLEFVLWYIEYYYNLLSVDSWYYPYEDVPLASELTAASALLYEHLVDASSRFGSKKRRIEGTVSKTEQYNRLIDIFTYTGTDDRLYDSIRVTFNCSDEVLDVIYDHITKKSENVFIREMTDTLIRDHRNYFSTYGLVEGFPTIHGSFKIEISLMPNGHHQVKIIDRHKKLILLTGDFGGQLTRPAFRAFLKSHISFSGIVQMYLYPKRGQIITPLIPINYTFINQILSDQACVFTCLLYIPKMRSDDFLDLYSFSDHPTPPLPKDLSFNFANQKLPKVSDVNLDYQNFVRVSRKKLLWGNYNQLFFLEGHYDGTMETPDRSPSNKKTLPTSLSLLVAVHWERVQDSLHLVMSAFDQKIFLIKHPFNSKEWMVALKKGILRLINSKYCYQGINYDIVSHSKLPLPLKYVYLEWGEELALTVNVIHRKKLPDNLKFQIKYQKYQNLVTFYHQSESTVSVDNENMVSNDYLKKVVSDYLYQHYYIQKTPNIHLYRPYLPNSGLHSESGYGRQSFDINRTRAINIFIDIEIN
jgi:hypothetical protein